MAGLNELPPNRSRMDKGSVFSVFSLGDNRRILTPGKSSVPSALDSSALVHRTHAFSYSPRNSAFPQQTSPETLTPKEKSTSADERLRLTLTCTDTKIPRKGRRRSSLFGVNMDSPRQLQVTVLNTSQDAHHTKQEHTDIGQRSPRRYSAAQGSLDDISHEAARLLHQTYSDNTTSRNGPTSLAEPNIDSVMDNRFSCDTRSSGQALVAATSNHENLHDDPNGWILPQREISPILAAISRSPGLMPERAQSPTRSGNTSLGRSQDVKANCRDPDVRAQSSYADSPGESSAFLRRSYSKPNDNDFDLTNLDKVSESSHLFLSKDAAPNKEFSIGNRSNVHLRLSTLSGGLKSLHTSSEAGANDKELECAGVSKALDKVSNSESTAGIGLTSTLEKNQENKANIEQGVSEHRDHRDYNTIEAPAQSAIESGMKQDYQGAGFLSWAFKFGTWMCSPTDKADKVDASRKELNMIAPSSF
ncbi:hypothetical protein PoB_001338500 [Plakobranchus ocellatus]|uniref:Uncharacterized protein n=1 Tax=Plakobranchus ocellatus TaxID=259542 RepID=A0AAV3YVJ3_9GAST|nr:hypothetical protein PoB_001338500 [Plakobranchus ocellatus]